MACGSDSTGPTTASDSLVLTAAAIASINSTAQAVEQANPANATVRALMDSTMLVLTAGVTAKRLDVSTDLTSAPLYFVGVRRTYAGAQTSWSTWSIVGFDDPAKLTSIVEVSGFAQGGVGNPPHAVSGTIGDGTGVVNALMMSIGTAGSVTLWNARTGAVSFSSDSSTVACPGFTPTAHVTCTMETMHVHFTANAPSGSGGAAARQASITTEVAVPAMHLTISP